jgi:ABC-2 type transport system permease protein
MVRDGSFDLMLVRPVGSLFQVISSDFALRRLGKALQGLAVLAYALSSLHLAWTLGKLVMLPLMIVTGTAIFSSIWIIGTTSAFWTVEMREVTNAFTYGGSFLASYPINIFGGWLRRLLAFIIPTAFVSYFPGLYILGKSDPLGTPDFLRFCTPLIAVVLALLAGRIWGFGVRHYRSTGS